MRILRHITPVFLAIYFKSILVANYSINSSTKTSLLSKANRLEFLGGIRGYQAHTNGWWFALRRIRVEFSPTYFNLDSQRAFTERVHTAL